MHQAFLASITLGNGNDTIFSENPGNGSGEATVHVGNGHDSIALGYAHFNIVAGNGSDTIQLFSGDSTVLTGFRQRQDPRRHRHGLHQLGRRQRYRPRRFWLAYDPCRRRQ